jgi:MoxR-like ATPase
MRTNPLNSHALEFEERELGGVAIQLPSPTTPPDNRYVGDGKLVRRSMAAWEAGLHFSLIGPPGVGKNELVYELARSAKVPLHIMQGHEELTPEDLAAGVRIRSGNRTVEYIGSPLLAAMADGGICFFDEIGKVPARALSLLASVLDERRTLTSAITGIILTAHPEFRFCGALNDADACSLPAYINERLQPRFKVGHQTPEETAEIVRIRLGLAAEDLYLLESFRDEAARQETPSPRLALTIVKYARQQWLSHQNRTRNEARRLIQEAFEVVAIERG